MGAGSNAPRCLISGGSRPSDKGRRGGNPASEIRRGPGVQKNFLSALWSSVRVGGLGPSLGYATVDASETGLCSGNVGLIRWCLS